MNRSRTDAGPYGDTTEGLRSLGELVRRHREALGLRQVDLANRIKDLDPTGQGIGQTGVSNIEAGRTLLPSRRMRDLLGQAIGVTNLDLLVAAREITDAEIAAYCGRTGLTEDERLKLAVVSTWDAATWTFVVGVTRLIDAYRVEQAL